MKRSMLVIGFAGVVAFVAGCASPATRYYTLTSATRDEPPICHVSVGLPIAIHPVTVPELVDRPQIVTRRGANRVFIDDFARWAEPLKVQITHRLASDVAHRLPEATVSTLPQRADTDALRVTVNVETFDLSREDVTMKAVWSVQPPTPGSKPIRGRTAASEKVGAEEGDDARAMAASKAVAVMAADIARAVCDAGVERGVSNRLR